MAQSSEMAQSTKAMPARVFAPWQALTKALFDDYRPELHYMRGPGPKCHAKRAYLMAQTATTTAAAGTNIANLRG